MALYEYYCEKCEARFEQLISFSDPNVGKCPECQSNQKTRKLISRFAVGGQGDLRESTFHGCHGSYTGGPGEAHGHSHDHGAAHDHDHGAGNDHAHDHHTHDHSPAAGASGDSHD